MTPDQIQRTYADLAEVYDRQGQLRQRDWFLVLAADAAQSADRPGEADRLLGRLLSLNPHHFLKPFGSFAEALRSPDVQGYVANLRRNYPPAKAAEILGGEMGKGQEEQRPDDATLLPPSRPVAPAPLARKNSDEPEILFARVRSAPEEEPAVFPLAPEPEPPRPAPPAPPLAPTMPLAPLSPPPPVQAPPPRPRAPQHVPPPRQAPEPAAFASEPKPVRPRAARPAVPPPAASPFVPSALFALLLLLGLALAVYTFVRPFLPPEWVP